MEKLAAPETELSSVLYIHMTPYIAEGWCCALHDLDITRLFPFLVNYMAYGSPIGNPPPLQHTFIPANLPSTLRLLNIVDNEIAAELMAKRMLGPFSIIQANIIFGGHFFTYPLGLIEKSPSSGKW